jgi:EAL domain-containing protein (putative c-di-GMP-specific phosphodiesterase class I)
MTARVMSSSRTTTATFEIRVRDLRPTERRRRRYPSAIGSFSSPAGLNCRPWFARLRRALREDLFVLRYQPIVSLHGGGISHYEALIRLADRADGLLEPPGEFLAAAERYGLIAEIDRLVLSKVARLLGGELAGSDARVAVNLSALSITDGGMLEHIERELRRHSVAPDRLVVEITETAAICDMARAVAFCEGVQRIGGAIALDDFGAGFGSFHYLKHLPFSYLKIDGEFVRALPASRKDQLVVQALVGVARGMGKQTIAEYVGDEPTIGLLRDYGVDYAQGFQVGRPVHQAEAFAAIG